MLVPTKFTTLEESTIFKMKVILEKRVSDENIFEALRRTEKTFQDASEFLHALDALYVLKLIDIDASTGIISYAE